MCGESLVMPLDLRLASSYVPALVCVSKGLLVGGLTYFLFPLGGGAVVGLLLLLDRIYLNSTSVVDVNSVIAFVTVLTAATRDRATNGIDPPAGVVVTSMWAMLSVVCSFAQPLSFRVEMLLLSISAVLTSVTQMPSEIVWLLMVRVVCMLIPVLLLVYTTDGGGAGGGGGCIGGFDLVLSLLRAAPIMLAPLIPSLVISVVLSAVVVWRWRKTQLGPGDIAGPDSVMSEQALLREALARQKNASQHIC